MAAKKGTTKRPITLELVEEAQWDMTFRLDGQSKGKIDLRLDGMNEAGDVVTSTFIETGDSEEIVSIPKSFDNGAVSWAAYAYEESKPESPVSNVVPVEG